MSSAIQKTLIQRKTLQACDACRTRRGDGHQNKDGVCSNCKRYKQPCEYGTPANALKWGTKAYIEDLQLRIASVERLIKRHAPDKDLSDLLDDAPSGPNPPSPSKSNLILPPRFFLPSGERAETHSSQCVQDVEVFLTTDTMQSGRGEYYGSTSPQRLVEFAIEFHDGAKSEPMPFEERFKNRRGEFWEVQDWMGLQPGPSSTRLEFPPPDIIASMVDSYFTHSNLYFPVLHRPTFQRLLDQNLHRRDYEFGSLLLVVCAIGARFSDHPYVSGIPHDSPDSCMARWLSQTRKVMRKPFTSTATLFEVQYYCLHGICLSGFPAPMRWITLGIGMGLAKSVGADRAKTYGDKPTIEGELWKRVFWVLLNNERFVSTALGRACSARAEDFDLELPIDCDDEYWPVDDETEGFKQPPGKPSKLTVFILMIKLFHLQADVIRVIYPPNRDPSFRSPEAERRIFSTLDVEMDKWAKSIPEHLRQLSFEPLADPDLVRQSIYLHAHYHMFQMWVRRPYTLPNKKDSPLAPAATAMCTNSAVACYHLLDKLKHPLGVDLTHYESPIFITTGTFLINVLSQRPLEDTTRDRELLEKCLELFELMEKRGHSSSMLFSVIAGVIRDPDFDPLPDGGLGEGGRSNLVVNTKKSKQRSNPETATSSESSRPSSADVIGGDMGFDFGLDVTFI